MKRRNFLKTSAGFAATVSLTGFYSIQSPIGTKKKFKFRDHQKSSSFGHVQIVTPDDGYYIHTFYDICPFSPSQKYLAVNKFPFQKEPVKYGDLCDICVVDLENETIETVYRTKGWGYQLGANLNWGKTDRYLYTNDIIDNEAVCVRIDIETGETRAYSGPMYHMAPDESAVLSFPLTLINGYQDGKSAQMGYGVPPFKEINEIKGAPADMGLLKTDLKRNKTEILVSLKQAFEVVDDDFYNNANCYFFHTKYNKQGTHILQVFRGVLPGSTKYHPTLLAFNADGTDIHRTISREYWSPPGHHPNWHPNGKEIVMNLTPRWMGIEKMMFCIFNHTGEDFRLLSEKIAGSGHPSINEEGTYLISDMYVGEYSKLGFKECPIRLINLETDTEAHICTVFTDVDIPTSTYRVDPHPAWSRDYKKVCFNGAPEGKRQVFVANLESEI